MFSQILVEFLFRLTFGVAAAMAVTPSRWVTSGFFRVHLWVLLGVQTLAALAVHSEGFQSPSERQQFWLAVVAAVTCYVGSVLWMYDRQVLGKLAIVLIACCCYASSAARLIDRFAQPIAMHLINLLTGGLLLGLVTTSMLLGHWYLNTPTMKLEPLKRLIVMAAVVVVLRMGVGALGASTEWERQESIWGNAWILFLSLRWLTGIVGVLILLGLTWQTLRVPNTQSATGILYSAVILTFIGELTSQLLTLHTRYPV